MQELRAAWSKTPLGVKVGIIVVLLVVVLGASAGVGTWYDHYKDRRFDEKMKKLETERDDLARQTAELTTERDKLVARADEAEKRAADAEARVQINEVAIAAAGARVIDANEKLKKEDERYAEELKNSGRDNITPCERWIHNCETAKQLGLKPKSEQCKCN
ncbi:MAG TPA: hypothetical protein VJH03_14625 [Blastocatellia bacterium]|nr:hypothetical protein [Blastocatellia bacterium]